MVTQNALLNLYGNIESCFTADNKDFTFNVVKKIGLSKIESFLAQRNNKDIRIKAEEILTAARRLNIRIITRENSAYPIRFKDISTMPILLYTKGDLRINEYEKSIGVVGARRCSDAGKREAIEVSIEAVKNNVAVISGMAKGIDSYAHTATIKNRGYTIAVLGNGLDICYPKEHEKLYNEIITQGCILSEYPPKTPPRDYFFPNRNRLIAALSDKIYVVDAGRKSGTESTIKFAQRYCREVIAYQIPDPINI